MGPTVYGKPGKGREFDFGIQVLKSYGIWSKFIFWSENLTLARENKKTSCICNTVIR